MIQRILLNLCVILILITCIEIPYRGFRVSKSAKSIFKDNQFLLKSLTNIIPPAINNITEEIGTFWNRRTITISNIKFPTFTSNFSYLSTNFCNFTETGILEVEGSGNVFNVQIILNYTYQFFDGTIPISGVAHISFQNDLIYFEQNYNNKIPSTTVFCKWKMTQISLSNHFMEETILNWMLNIINQYIEPQLTYAINLQLDNQTKGILDNYNYINQKYGALSIDITNKMQGVKYYVENSIPYVSFQYNTSLEVTDRPFYSELYNTIFSQIDPNSGHNYDLSACFNLDIFIRHTDLMAKSRYFLITPTEENISSPLTIDFVNIFRPEISSYFNEYEKINMGCKPISELSLYYIKRTATPTTIQVQFPWQCMIDSDRTGERLLELDFFLQTYFAVSININANLIYFTALAQTEISELTLSPPSKNIGSAEASLKLIPFKFLNENYVSYLIPNGIGFPEIRNSSFTFKDFIMSNGEICIFYNDNV